MSKSRKKSNRRAPVTNQAWVWVILLIVVIVLISLGLEWLKSDYSPKPEIVPHQTEHHKLPPRETTQKPLSSIHEQYSSTHQKAKPSKPLSGPVSTTQAPYYFGTGKGVIALIIDDMGSDKKSADTLIKIGVPLTFSVIPGLAASRSVAETAKAHNYQVMIHMPMEPQGYPKQRLEKNGLLLSQDDDEIASRVSSYMEEVPYAVGANNHMGSAFTENSEKMEVVLKDLKGKGLFFIDSRTTPNSVGYSLAKKMGVKTGTRNVFLDNVQNSDAINKQLKEAATIARRKGSAIVICHPHSTTIKTLQESLPELAKSGITFVRVSQLVK
ncbi:MAG: divergent polysaccharide deacetylase family protein [Desulfuromonadales bacterium]|nr:divergent polysaccharide deacetylase family protein [Desulfuromonadales bacterium]